MFDGVVAGRDPAALIVEIEQAARAEARASARTLAAIAELIDSTVAEDDERADWCFDGWSNAAAQVGAALGVGLRRASAQMRIAVALRYRLPRVADLALSGVLSARVVAEITWRTQLVEDPQAVAAIDAALARCAPRWGALSAVRLVTAIDAVIARCDPDAVRRAREVVRSRDLRIGAHDDPQGMTAVWGRLTSVDAAALEARVAALVGGLCAGDPRSAGERRADALGVLAHGVDQLGCRCGAPACAAAGSSVVIRVIADQSAVDAAQELIAEDATAADQAGDRAAAPEPGAPPRPSTAGVALLPDGSVLPVPVLAEAIRSGAAIRPLRRPGPGPEPRYRPSDRLAEFVRSRDLVCRFPGCPVPADRCDIDHVVAWPHGPTHAANLACTCRDHHLAKTFWDGWSVRLDPDATMIWTTPTGTTYATVPGSRLVFPDRDVTTAALPPMTAQPPPPDPGRTLRMPRRRQTRAAHRAAHITAERARNAHARAATAERARNSQAPVAPTARPPGDDPPPF